MRVVRQLTVFDHLSAGQRVDVDPVADPEWPLNAKRDPRQRIGDDVSDGKAEHRKDQTRTRERADHAVAHEKRCGRGKGDQEEQRGDQVLEQARIRPAPCRLVKRQRCDAADEPGGGEIRHRRDTE